MKFNVEAKILAGAIVIVLVVMLVSFALPLEYGSTIMKVGLYPGYILWEATNTVCPPTGSRCFLGSERAIAHHGWAFICYIIGWFVVIRITLALRSALTRPSI